MVLYPPAGVHRAACRTLLGQGPHQVFGEVAEIIAAGRMVERAGAVSEQLAGHRHGPHRDRARRGQVADQPGERSGQLADLCPIN